MGCLWALCAGRPHLVGWKCEDTSSCFPIKQLMGIGIYLSVTLGNLSWLSLWTPNWCPTYQIYSPSFKCSPSSGPYTWLFCGIVERKLRSLKLYIYFSVVTWDCWVNRWCHSDMLYTVPLEWKCQWKNYNPAAMLDERLSHYQQYLLEYDKAVHLSSGYVILSSYLRTMQIMQKILEGG